MPAHRSLATVSCRGAKVGDFPPWLSWGFSPAGKSASRLTFCASLLVLHRVAIRVYAVVLGGKHDSRLCRRPHVLSTWPRLWESSPSRTGASPQHLVLGVTDASSCAGLGSALKGFPRARTAQLCSLRASLSSGVTVTVSVLVLRSRSRPGSRSRSWSLVQFLSFFSSSTPVLLGPWRGLSPPSM